MYVIYMMITIIQTLYKNEKGRILSGNYIENNVKVVIYCVVGISRSKLLHLVFKYFDMSLLPMWKKFGLHIK